MEIPWHVIASQKWRGLAVLRRHLGWTRALRLGLELEKRLQRGMPFGEESSLSVDPDVRWSRAQIGPAIVLYNVLRESVESERALEWTRAVVLESAEVWMRHALGDLNVDRWRQLDSAGRLQLLSSRTSRFRNMTLADVRVAEDSAFFRVTACRFPALCADAGVPELAPVFCEVDAHFFGGVEKSIRLERPETLATGGGGCPFSLAWVGDSQP